MYSHFIHKIALTGDISKMFRVILLQESERNFHRFLQRSETGQLQDWRMKRLNFRVASAPYLAIQNLQQAVSDRNKYPRASETSFYVDNCLTGVDNLADAQFLRQ